MEKIKRYVIYNDGVEYEYIPAGNRNEPRWCKDGDVKELEIEIEMLKANKEGAMKAAEYWKNNYDILKSELEEIRNLSMSDEGMEVEG
jgi:hypothetical protein